MTMTTPAIWFGATALTTVLVTLSLAAWFSVDFGRAMAQTAPGMLALAALAAIAVLMLRQESV